MLRKFGIVLFVPAALALAAGRPAAQTTAPANAQAMLARLPLRFEANQGQFDSSIRYVARAGNYNLLLTDGGPVFSTPGSMPAGFSLSDSNPHARIEPIEPLTGRTDYFIGRRENWHTGVQNYAKVRYRSVYPGVDLLYYGSQSLLEYDFVVQPGADPAAIGMKFSGQAHASLSPAGDLVVEIGARKFIEHAPYIYQEDASGARRHISGGYRLMADGSVKLHLGRYDHSKTLVIDPTIEYCTYIGGPGLDTVNAAKLLPNGLLYIAGQTDSGQIPYINGAFNNNYTGLTDIFLQILDTTPSGGFQPVYSSYIGGSGNDIPLGLDVDASGIFYVCGSTTSFDFPMAGNSYQTTGGASNQSAIVFQLNPALYGGISLLYTSYLSGTTGSDAATGIAVDSNQIMYLVGTARSSDFPVSLNAYQADLWGQSDVFIAKMDPNAGTLPYCSYIGGEDEDFGEEIRLVGPKNLVYFTASTFSTEYAMAGYQISAAPFGGEDAIFGVMDLTQQGLSGLVYSTYLGGSQNDAVSGLALDPQGNAILTGYTISTNFPVTPDAVQSTYGGDTDAWVAVINPNLPFSQGLLYSSYLGGSGGDAGIAAASDAAGDIFVTGYTMSPNFPVANAVQGNWPGGINTFVTELKRGSAGASGLLSSTYIGATGSYMPTAIAVSSNGTAFVVGFAGVGLPTSPASAQGGYAGGPSDGFVLAIGGLPSSAPPAAVPGQAPAAESKRTAPRERLLKQPR